ncbi:DUF2637 domain-containing protein [Citricoccus nitrophenolicus]|uniref:DUF2637 domain-containing protein n=1 Tax=Citricoccus nitrophenolicus TaxID=863575 RepID=A0ABV0IH32_9MICC
MSNDAQPLADAVDSAKSWAVERDSIAGLALASTGTLGGADAVDARKASSWLRDRATESTVPRRINPDDARFIRLVVAGVVVAGVVAFAISFTALYEVAGWLGLPPFMWWAVPVFIDLAILVYAASVLVHKARGERTLASWAALGTFTALSVFANAAHAWSYVQDHDQAWQGVVGAVIAGMVPVAIFVATEQLSRVAVEDPESRRAELKELARMEQARAEHERQLVQMGFEREKQERQMANERMVAKRAAELDRERHETEVAKIQARRSLEVRQSVRPSAEGPFPDTGRIGRHDGRPESPVPMAGQEPTKDGLHVVTAVSSAPTAVGSGDRSELDEVADFAARQIAVGAKVSAVMLAERFGISERTGRRRLKALREERPKVFSQPGSGSWRDEA